MEAEKRLLEMGLELPPAPSPIGSYVTVKRSGNLLYLSGSGPIVGGRAVYQGKVGGALTPDEGYEAARLSALNALAVLREYLGGLDRVKSIVKLLGFVACAEGFYSQPSVINGASDLLAAVFGPDGVHARSAVGVFSLPMDIPVEIELIAEMED